MRIGYYPGCSLKGSSREYAESLLAVAPALDLELVEIEDWNCCGASAAHNLNHLLSLALPVRALATAEKQGLEEILVPCAACYSHLMTAYQTVLDDEAERKRIVNVIEMDIQGNARPLNILQVLEKAMTREINGRFTQPFDFKVACYYGCLLVRPPKLVNFDQAEDPQVMDQLMQKLGATPIDWAFKTECCGAGFSVPRTDLVAKMCGQILEDAVSRGAEAIIVACPMCHSNLDMRRSHIERLAKKKYGIPVLYITQAIGLAMGMDAKTLGLQRHIVKVNLPKAKIKADAEKAE
jgi:heterodisulfide reductase subunit B